jgi:hypothetical protein
MNKLTSTISILLLTGSLATCGQIQNKNNSQQNTFMDTSKLTNPVAKAAFEAWQQGNSKGWLSHFTPDAQLFDDGHTRDFHRFSTEAIGHERFTSIDKVENNGLDIYGKFHSDTWGNFKTYFKFHLDNNNKIYKLEIGQADY